MLSQTVEYALRATVQLAVDSSGQATTKDIAAKPKVPSAYLAKVLQSMRRGRTDPLPSRSRRRRYARQAGRQDLAAGHHRRGRAAEADAQQESPGRRPT